MKLTSVEELKEKHLGKIGTPKRDKYEQELKILKEINFKAHQRDIQES